MINTFLIYIFDEKLIMKTTKICFKCKKEKPIIDFYKHLEMLDGYLGKCKECTKNDVKSNYQKKIKDINWIEKERERCREKYSRLDYKNKYSFHNEKFKFRKSSKFKNIHRYLKLKRNEEAHHWNYNEGYERDVFILSNSNHKKVHLQMFLDIEFLLYRTKTGELLETKQKHEMYINSLF